VQAYIGDPFWLASPRSGANLAGIMGDADADTEGLTGRGDEGWDVGRASVPTRGRKNELFT